MKLNHDKNLNKLIDNGLKLIAILFIIFTGFTGLLLFNVLEEHEKIQEKYSRWKRQKLTNKMIKGSE